MLKVKTTAIMRALKRHLFTKQMLDLVLISALGTLSLTWFRGDFLILPTEFEFPPRPLDTLMRTFFAWDSLLRVENSRILAGAIPHEFLRIGLIELLKLPVVTAEKVWAYLIFTLPGLSMYYLFNTCIKGKRIAALTSAVFYMMNPYVLTFVWRELSMATYFYAFLPLKLALFIRALNGRKSFKYVFLLCLIWIGASTTAYVNPVYLFLDWAVLTSYLVFHILTTKDKAQIRHNLKFFFSLTLLWSILNFYWFLPLVFFSIEEYAKAQAAVITISELQMFKLNSAPLYDAVRLTGFWALNAGYQGDPYIAWGPMYSSTLFLAIGFLMPVLAFTPLLLKPRNRYTLFFAMLTLLGLFLVKGPYPPLGEVTEWFYVNTGLLTIFKSTYKHLGFLIAIGYAFLIGVAVNDLNYILRTIEIKRLNSHKRLLHALRKGGGVMFVALFIFLLFGVYAWPFWTGDIIYPGGRVITSARVSIPDYYYDAANWLSQQEDCFRILSLPLSRLGHVAYLWDYGHQGTDPTLWLFFPKQKITSSQWADGLSETITSMIYANSTDSPLKVIASMNVKYILFHRDANWKYISETPLWVQPSSPDLESKLSAQKGAHLEKTFRNLAFYINEYWKPMHIYAVSDSILVSGGSNDLIQAIESVNNFTSDEFVFFASDHLTHEQQSFIAKLDRYNSKPQIMFEKINPTKYVVHVNASKPFFLVFSESYHEDWIAQVEGQQIPNEHHYMANGFANSWYINKTGSFTVTLEFWPQKLFYIGVTISITVLTLCTLCLIRIDWLKGFLKGTVSGIAVTLKLR